MKRILFIALTCCLFLTSPAVSHAENGSLLSPPLLAVAVSIDTGSTKVPGMDYVNRAINEFLQSRINSIMLGGVVLSGSNVLADLQKSGVSHLSDASESSLTQYGKAGGIDYILLFCLRPLDITVDLKAFNVKKGQYVFGKTVTEIKNEETGKAASDWSLTSPVQSLTNRFTALINQELGNMLGAVLPEKSTPAEGSDKTPPATP